MKWRGCWYTLVLLVVLGAGTLASPHGPAAASTPLRHVRAIGCGAGLQVLRHDTSSLLAARATASALPLTRSYVTLAGIRVRLQRMPGSVYALAVYGDTVVWAGGGHNYGDPSKLYAANLRHFWPRILAVAQPCRAFGDVRISAHWIAWTGPAPHRPADEVWALDRRTGQRFLVDTQWALQRFDCGGLACQPPLGIALDGDTIAWTHVRLGRSRDVVQSTISIRTLPKGPSSNLVTTTATCLVHAAPQLAAGQLVWLQFRWKAFGHSGVPGNAHNCAAFVSRQVMSENLRTRAVELLSRGPSAAMPTTNGRYVAWQTGQCFLACYSGNVTLADLSSGLVATISPSAVTSQRLAGQILIWRRDDLSNTAIVVRDVTTRRQCVLAHSRDIANATVLDDPGWGSGRRVVWPQRETAPDGSLVTYVAVAEVP